MTAANTIPAPARLRLLPFRRAGLAGPQLRTEPTAERRSAPRRLGLTGGKPRLRRVPNDGRVGSGSSNDSQQSFAPLANGNSIVETAPPRMGTPAAWFSELT